MANAATVITITAGGLTFANEWYQTKNIDWKVPVATVILAAGVDVFAGIDSKGAVILSLMIMLGAATTKFNGRSPIDTLTETMNAKSGKTKPKQKVSK